MTSAALAPHSSSMSVPPVELRNRLLSKGDKLQMLPGVVMEALTMAKDPKCSISDFAAIVHSDVRLAADILRVTNSVVYAAKYPILNLQQAVTRLGLAHCRNVILTASLGSVMRRMTLSEAWIQTVLWRHSVLTGMLSVKINRLLELGFTGEEFAAGLIHDVGRSLIGVIAPTQMLDADPLDFDESIDVLKQERVVLQSDHTEIGAWFMTHNQIPKPLVDVVRFHHRPADATENQRLVSLVAVADDMANHIQRANGPDGYIPNDNPALESLIGHNVHDLKRFSDDALGIMANTIQEAASDKNPFAS